MRGMQTDSPIRRTFVRLFGQSLARGRLKLSRRIAFDPVELAALLAVLHLFAGPAAFGAMLLSGCFLAAWRADRYLMARARRRWRRKRKHRIRSARTAVRSAWSRLLEGSKLLEDL
jgi:hypothetical protein